MKIELSENADHLIGGETTRLLKRWSEGDQSSFEQLESHIHAELHRLASRFLQGERSGHILQATVIVHDAYIQLLQLNKNADERKMIPWKNRAHFIGVAAGIMRHIIVDYIRGAKALKRGGEGGEKISIDKVEIGVNSPLEEVITVHELLDKLGEVNPLWKSLVELYYFGGLTLEEIGEILGIPTATVERHLKKAIKWLYLESTSGNFKTG